MLHNVSSFLRAEFDWFLHVLMLQILENKGTDDVIDICFCFFTTFMYFKAELLYSCRFFPLQHAHLLASLWPHDI